MEQAKKKFYLFLIVFITVLVVPLYLGESYFSGEINRVSENIVNAKQSMDEVQRKNEQLSESKEKYQEIKDKIDEVSEVVINDGDIVFCIEAIEEIARENNVKWEINSIDREEESSSYIGYNFLNVRVGGDFDDVMHFLYSLENFRYYINVEDVKMSYGNLDEYNSDVVIMNSTIRVYQKTK